MTNKRIAILFHENDTDHTLKCSLISEFSRFWIDDGHEVIYLFGTKEYIPADLLFVHVDVSVVPDSYIEFSKKYPITVNASVKDIRKSVITKHILHRNSNWSGPVIVKSDRNSAGIPERMRSGLTGRIKRKILRKFSHAFPNSLLFNTSSQNNYRIFNHLHDVPRYCFINPKLVVQKFIPEMDDGLFCVRNMTFLGDRSTCVRLKSKAPIVNGETTEVMDHSVESHPDIIQLRHKLGFEYGKFDYVEVNGKAILLDANKTIGFSQNLDDDSGFQKTRRYRAEGLYSFFKQFNKKTY